VITVFQPHRYTRTQHLRREFLTAFYQSDVLIVMDIYAAGEAPIAGADAKALCRAVRTRGRVEPVLLRDLEELPAALAGLVRDGDVVLTMGAGSIGAAAHELPQSLPGALSNEGART
jgi:UDP-N-acetylmuramate--alanine ligase